MIRRFRPSVLLLFCALLLAGLVACSGTATPPAVAVPDPAPEGPVDEAVGSGADADPMAEPEPGKPLSTGAIGDTAVYASWAEETLAKMTLRQKVAQMIMPIVLGDYAPKGSVTHDRVARLVEEVEVGGVIVSVGSPTDVAVKLNDLQGHARVPLLVGSDLETGPGFRLSGAVHSPTNIVLGGATQFPNLMALGAADDSGLAYEMGRITAEEARAVGIHVPFAPVLDVNNNPDNPIINVRSFGEDPEQVARLGAAFVRGVQEHGAIATGKHFPGHGDTGVDSHLSLPLIDVSRARMDSVELVPFRRAVEAGMGGIRARTLRFGYPADSQPDVCLKEGYIVFKHPETQEEERYPTVGVRVPGKHNLENMMSALAASSRNTSCPSGLCRSRPSQYLLGLGRMNDVLCSLKK